MNKSQEKEEIKEFNIINDDREHNYDGDNNLEQLIDKDDYDTDDDVSKDFDGCFFNDKERDIYGMMITLVICHCMNKLKCSKQELCANKTVV